MSLKLTKARDQKQHQVWFEVLPGLADIWPFPFCIRGTMPSGWNSSRKHWWNPI